MPEHGIPLSPRAELATAQEILEIAKVFVKRGVTKIRLTGGEPLVRKDFSNILENLSALPVELAITTNALLVDRFIADFKAAGLQKINVSLDSLNPEKFKTITRRDMFDKTYSNILKLVNEGFEVKLNAVLIKGFNDNEIRDFIGLAKDLNIHIRFIEFMPFDGNNWDKSKVVSEKEVLETANLHFGESNILRIEDRQNDTSRNYRVQGFQGTFAMISSVTNPFCGTCNRLRLTANGRMKNCLFSSGETDLLTALREGKSIDQLIDQNLSNKHKSRGGMDSMEKLSDEKLHSKNRSMISIGG